MMQPTLFDMGSSFTNRRTKAVTFQGKLDLPIHRWYRLTPSFSPQLANDIAHHFELSSADFVLDPFSGVGTVPLCMKYRGIPACSVEINPYLHFVGNIKTRTYRDIDDIESCFKRFIDAYHASLDHVPFKTNPREFLVEHAADIPPINFPERWWSPGNLAQLVGLRKLVATFDGKPHHLDLIKMAVLGILIPVSNAKHNHVSLTFADKPQATVDVAGALGQQLRNMVADILAVTDLPTADVTIHRGNSKELISVLPERPNVSAVITSPPYPNRFSYARETRPHLFFFEFIESATAVGQLETEAIGGTWGKATSVLASGVKPKNALIETLLNPYLRFIDSNGNLMANYVVKYFNDIYDHAGQVAQVCKKKVQLAYVIGNSKFYDHPLPSDEILASIFGHFGFKLERIDRMRKRQSKTGLYEAVVFMRRG
ncbi:MAG: hypothetical protein ACHRXM_00295 [Isosphaerales bacterium]